MKVFCKKTLSILLSATLLLTTFLGIGQVIAEDATALLQDKSVLVSGVRTPEM